MPLYDDHLLSSRVSSFYVIKLQNSFIIKKKHRVHKIFVINIHISYQDQAFKKKTTDDRMNGFTKQAANQRTTTEVNFNLFLNLWLITCMWCDGCIGNHCIHTHTHSIQWGTFFYTCYSINFFFFDEKIKLVNSSQAFDWQFLMMSKA